MLERVEKGDETVAAGVLGGNRAGVAAVNHMLEEGNLVGSGLGIARGGFDDFQGNVGGCLRVVGEPDGAKMTPSATPLAPTTRHTYINSPKLAHNAVTLGEAVCDADAQIPARLVLVGRLFCPVDKRCAWGYWTRHRYLLRRRPGCLWAQMGRVGDGVDDGASAAGGVPLGAVGNGGVRVHRRNDRAHRLRGRRAHAGD